MAKMAGTTSSSKTLGSEYIDPAYPMAGKLDMVYVDSVSLKQVASKAKVAPGTFYVDSTNNKLYIGNNPASKTVESTVLPDAFAIWKTGSYDHLTQLFVD